MSADEIVQKLFEEAKNRKITSNHIAEELNVSTPSVSHWRTGKKIPHMYNLIDLADLVGFEIVLKEKVLENDIVHGSDE